MVGVFSRNSLEHAVAGSTGTIVSTLLLFPLERLKTLLQVSSGPQRRFRQVLAQLLQEEGLLGLYRGCTPTLQTVAVSNFLYFFLFEGLKEPLATVAGRPEGQIGAYETLASSALAGAINMALTEPLWRACVVAQARPALGAPGTDAPKAEALGVLAVLRRLWAREGARSLWRGLGSSLWLVSNPVIQFFAYDFLKELRVSDADITSVEAFVIGAIAKALATVLTFPLQVAQSRLRAAQALAAAPGAAQPTAVSGMVPCLRAVFAENGIGGLYFGLVPKLVQTVTAAAFMFAFYEKVHWAIRRLSRKGARRLRRNIKSRPA